MDQPAPPATNDPDSIDWPRLAARYALPSHVRALPGERTRNAAVLGEQGEPVAVLKVHPAQDAADLDLEHAVLGHLARTGALHGQVPYPIRSGTGAEVVELTGPDGVRLARALVWVPGRTWREALDGAPASPAALAGIGALVARLDLALADLDHPHADRPLRWNLTRAPQLLPLVDAVPDPARREVARAVLQAMADQVAPVLATLPAQVIHNDANDANLVVGDDGLPAGLIDFGDVCRAPRVCGLAIAIAYALDAVRPALDPALGVVPLVAAYHRVAPLTEVELGLLLPLVRARLATSLVMAGVQHAADPGNDYLLSSQDAVWSSLGRLDTVEEVLALARWRAACGFEPSPLGAAVREQLAAVEAAPILGRPLGGADGWPFEVADWSGPQPEPVQVRQDSVIVGRYLEERAVYTTEAFRTAGGEPRTVHLGVDLFVPPGRALHAPLDGVVEACGDNDAPLDYGPVIVLRHTLPDGAACFTLYGHLSRGDLVGLRPGTPIAAGEVFAHVGTQAENGGWAPHVHVQLLLDLVGMGLDVAGVAPRSELAVWAGLCPDPNLLLRIPGPVAAQSVPVGTMP